MTANMAIGGNRLWRRMRWVLWGGAALLLMLPLVAMQFTSEVNWTPFDFIVMGAMLGLACAAFELAVRMARSNLYLIAAGVAIAAAFLMIWINLAVGIIGNERNPDNLMFVGVLAIGLIAVAFSRLKSLGMARAMETTAIAQAVVSVIAVIIGERDSFLLIVIFVVMWLISAQLFRRAARRETQAA